MDEYLESLPKTQLRSLLKWLFDALDLPLISCNDCLPLIEEMCGRSPEKCHKKGGAVAQKAKERSPSPKRQ